MAETDAKRDKINELLDYIDTRLTELEEEKEELKEFQEKDKERRCLEYAVYQRELEEVGEALEEIEEERRGEVHNANLRREQFNDRQKQVQVGPFSLSWSHLFDSSSFFVELGAIHIQGSHKPHHLATHTSRRAIRAYRPRSITHRTGMRC